MPEDIISLQSPPASLVKFYSVCYLSNGNSPPKKGSRGGDLSLRTRVTDYDWSVFSKGGLRTLLHGLEAEIKQRLNREREKEREKERERE